MELNKLLQNLINHEFNENNKDIIMVHHNLDGAQNIPDEYVSELFKESESTHKLITTGNTITQELRNLTWESHTGYKSAQVGNFNIKLRSKINPIVIDIYQIEYINSLERVMKRFIESDPFFSLECVTTTLEDGKIKVITDEVTGEDDTIFEGTVLELMDGHPIKLKREEDLNEYIKFFEDNITPELNEEIKSLFNDLNEEITREYEEELDELNILSMSDYERYYDRYTGLLNSGPDTIKSFWDASFVSDNDKKKLLTFIDNKLNEYNLSPYNTNIMSYIENVLNEEYTRKQWN